MQHQNNAFIDDVIGRIPVVGSLWADALHVWMGVANAMNLAALRDESLAGPAPARATVATPASTPEPLRRAA
jgi:hypothetical protein